MAENIIKDFVKKQTSSITIGTPKARPSVQEQPAPASEPAPIQEAVQVDAVVKSKTLAPASLPASSAPESEEKSSRGRGGRPKSPVEKVKMSVYVPTEVKEKLIKIQHMTYKQSVNDVFMEGIYMLMQKYDL